MNTMNAMMFHAPLDIRYEKVLRPSPQAGELLVKVHRALTCGTDLKCYRRGHPVLLGTLPSPFGHEFAGVVTELGEGIEAWQVGDRVVSANSAPCYDCFYCQKGQLNLCEHLKLLNGAYAEYIIVPERIVRYNTYKIPEALPFEVAAFTEPLAVAIRAVHGVGVQAGDEVLVLGLGPIGQLIVKVATLAGAKVTAVARTDLKLKMAESFGGAVASVSIAEGLNPEDLRQRFSPNGRGWDVVIEAVGLPETWEKAVALSRRGGKVHCFAGCASGSTVTLSTERLHYDEITLYSLFHHTPVEVKKAFEYLLMGQVDPRPLITVTYPLGEVEDALQGMLAGSVFKAAIDCTASL
ncbi:MAG: alcohol dehydrogenase catalytic domain-containing protein [Vampirovibrio sp.]